MPLIENLTDVEIITTPVKREAGWFGTYRLYFNCEEEAPRVWSIDDGDIKNEIKVEEVFLYTSAATRYVPSDEQPIAWLEGFGNVVVAEGVCVIEDKSTPFARIKRDTADNEPV